MKKWQLAVIVSNIYFAAAIESVWLLVWCGVMWIVFGIFLDKNNYPS